MNYFHEQEGIKFMCEGVCMCLRDVLCNDVKGRQGTYSEYCGNSWEITVWLEFSVISFPLSRSHRLQLKIQVKR